MYALFLILNDTTKLDLILEKLFEIGVGATVADTVGMGKMLSESNRDLPIFSSIRKIIDGDRPFNKTIISVIKQEEKLKKAKDIIKEELDYMKNPNTGFMFVVPVIECYGFGLKSDETKEDEKE
ncbi:nitrogen regulatory protein P-II family [Gottschalkia purinilytica]|uniref:Nitrogen regulatory protein P-II family n=1 Tax=Gottschalkia purinilytica TaxID=1503 RepID=A0A0L0WBW7_GOTPU|nr:hypothetical protein [Gottschalkia purinilytica]KNF08957.1 nitrogen regulatory protein P-II family [Gottschalkia purinilytica]